MIFSLPKKAISKEYQMARRCDICGKGPMTGNNDPKSHKRTNRVFRPNLHKIKAEINGEVKTIKVCSKCLKSGKVKKIVK